MPTAKELDKFYTRPEVANKLISLTCDTLGIDRQTQMFLEPSAGSGAFSSQIPNVMAYDFLPENNNIIQADFLELIPSWNKEDIICIGNPPFGHRAKLAIDFINHAASMSEAVCFVLPNTFRRYNIQNALDKNLALVVDVDLDEYNSFTYLDAPYALRCVFQIWINKDSKLFTNEMNDHRLISRPPISHEDFDCWQHNATEQSRKYLNEDWKYAFWRQGYKDYSKVFTHEKDYDYIKDVMYKTNLQLFLIKPLTEEADKIILEMDRDALAKQNLSTPGFGKADFVGEYIRIKNKK